jgi:hypothetical protein
MSNAQKVVFGGLGSSKIMTDKTSTGAGSSFDMIGGGRVTVEAHGTTTSGAGAASILARRI